MDGAGPYLPGVTVAPRPAPVVRVSDPRTPDRSSYAAPLPEEPVEERERARRGALPLVLLLVGLAVGAGASELRHAQQERVQEAAAAQVLDLRLEGSDSPYGVSSPSTSAGTPQGVSLRRELVVRNVGARSVRVLGAELVGGTMTSRGSGQELPHGEAWRSVLQGPLRCPDASPPYAPDGSLLRVRAMTGAGERSADLEVPRGVLEELQAAADRSCGLVPPEEAVQVEPASFSVGEDSATVELQVYVRSSAPLDLLRVEPGRAGLEVALRTGDRPPVLPVRLDSGSWPRAEDSSPFESGLQVELAVEDCGALRGPEADPYGELVRLVVQVGDAQEELPVGVYDPGAVDALVEQVC